MNIAQYLRAAQTNSYIQQSAACLYYQSLINTSKLDSHLHILHDKTDFCYLPGHLITAQGLLVPRGIDHFHASPHFLSPPLKSRALKSRPP